MEYFKYEGRGPLIMATLIGTRQEDITKTIDYYISERGWAHPTPKENEITKIEEVNIHCYFVGSHIDHWLEMAILPHVRFKVNANAYAIIVDQVRNFEQAKRGALYKLVPNHSRLYYLPIEIMGALRTYDWEQHREQMESWFLEREKSIMELEKAGHIAPRTIQ